MKKASRNTMFARFPFMLGVGAIALLAAGCNALHSVDLPTQVQDLGPGYKASNIYRRGEFLPGDLKRVALLPVTTTTTTAQFLDAGVESLEPLVYSELEKSKRFEIIPISRDDLRQWSGRTGWRADDVLPPDLFAKIRANTACDAVMFSQLTRYQPYQPIAVGWKFSLIETPAKAAGSTTGKSAIVWSVDEVLDSGDPAVASSARNYYTQHLRNEAASADVSTMMASPTRFGQYAIATLLGTLPTRPVSDKQPAKVQ
jgi:hypothetical protein